MNEENSHASAITDGTQPTTSSSSFVETTEDMHNFWVKVDTNTKRYYLSITTFVPYATLVAVGMITQFFFNTKWWFSPIAYFVTATLAFFTHWLGHKQFTGRWFRAHHIEHHIQAFPPNRYLANKFIAAKDANNKYYGPAILFPGVFAFVVCSVRAIDSFVMFVVSLGAALIADYIHTGLHLYGFWMEKYKFFQGLG